MSGRAPPRLLSTWHNPVPHRGTALPAPPGAPVPPRSPAAARGPSSTPRTAFFNRWYVFYDDVHRPMTPDLIGQLCVVGLADGRVLVKQVQRGRSEGLYTLHSTTEKPIADVKIEWAARVNSISRRS